MNGPGSTRNARPGLGSRGNLSGVQGKAAEGLAGHDTKVGLLAVEVKRACRLLHSFLKKRMLLRS